MGKSNAYIVKSLNRLEDITKPNDYRITKEIKLDNYKEVESFLNEGLHVKLDLKNLNSKNIGSDVWYFYSEEGVPIFRVPKSYARDASNSFTNDVSIDIIQNKNNPDIYLAQLTINDEMWLKNKQRIYPIVTQICIELVPEKR